MLTCDHCLDGNELRCKGRGCAAFERRRESGRRVPRVRTTTSRPPQAPVRRVPKVVEPERVISTDRSATERMERILSVEDLPYPLAYAVRFDLDHNGEVDEILSRFSGAQAPSRDQVLKTLRGRNSGQDFWVKVRDAVVA